MNSQHSLVTHESLHHRMLLVLSLYTRARSKSLGKARARPRLSSAPIRHEKVLGESHRGHFEITGSPTNNFLPWIFLSLPDLPQSSPSIPLYPSLRYDFQPVLLLASIRPPCYLPRVSLLRMVSSASCMPFDQSLQSGASPSVAMALWYRISAILASVKTPYPAPPGFCGRFLEVSINSSIQQLGQVRPFAAIYVRLSTLRQ